MAAQKAFFQAALGKAAATTQTAPAAPVAAPTRSAPTAASRPVVAAPDPQAARYARPGSRLNILV
jgi:hypothetical protein